LVANWLGVRGALALIVLLVLCSCEPILALPTPAYFATYHSYREVEGLLRELARCGWVRLRVIGTTWQGRPIYAVVVGDVGRKPVVLLVGLHHGRELISAQVPLYLAWLLANDPEYRELLGLYSFIVVPVLNPDGYEEAMRNPWHRKNCRPMDDDGDGLVDEDPPEDVDGDGRVALYRSGERWWYEGVDNDGDGRVNEDWVGGVDLNRNYPLAWELGVSATWSQIYRGPAPLSEPESGALASLIEECADRLALVISYHSGARLVLYPWSWSSEEPPDARLLRELGSAYARVAGYRLMQSSRLYFSFGELMDYVYGKYGVPALTIEVYGWALDPRWRMEHELRVGNLTIFKYAFEYFNPSPGGELLEVLRANAAALRAVLLRYAGVLVAGAAGSPALEPWELLRCWRWRREA